eukprot:CAMPEP_0184865938 /NCGR_PEP_ID=MMETSP0580-20130426/19854_1 /TAXON_ID=1118495 /ORGANISM="Dactyliosolen fragilissimus" /LENGTH=449 /DNA_ID=CAMNT_0027365341 /DNA_START=138 /DNA_END=1487 /DNA_ORIENTATION=-
MPWPTVLHKLISDENDDTWSTVIDRVKSHPKEAEVRGAGYGQTALHTACYRYPPLDAVRALLDACPSAALAQNIDGETPLHLASDGASEEVQRLILRAAPDSVRKADKYGDTPLHLAASSYPNLERFREMLQIDPTLVTRNNQKGETPFFLLQRSYRDARCREDISPGGEFADDWDSAILFLQAAHFGPSFSSMVSKGKKKRPKVSVVHAAAGAMCPRVLLATAIKFFPEQLSLQDENLRTPLHIAAAAPVFEEPVMDNEDDDETDGDDYDGDHGDPNETNKSGYILEHPNGCHQVDQKIDNLCHIQPFTSTLSPLSTQKPEKKSVLKEILEAYPKAASTCDSYGRLPFAVAIESGKCWEDINSLLKAEPCALTVQDKKTGLYPFMLAAANNNSDLNTSYNILLAFPELVSCGIPFSTDANNTATNMSHNEMCTLNLDSGKRKRPYDMI